MHISPLGRFWPRWRLSLKIILGFAFTGVVFIYLVIMAYQGVQQLIKSEIHFTPGFLVLSLACQLVGVFLAAALWSNILYKLGVASGYAFDLQVFGISAVARKLPGTVWYAASRLALYKYAQWPSATVVLALVVESFMIALGGLVAFGIGFTSGTTHLTLHDNDRYLLLLIPVFILGIGGLGPVTIKFAVKRLKKDLPTGQDMPRVNVLDTLRWLLGETAVIVLGAGVVFFLIKSIDENIFVPFVPILCAWGLAVALGPIAMWLPADIGLKDGVMYLVLSSLVGGPLAAVITLVWRLWVSLLEILLGLACGTCLSRTLRGFPMFLREDKK